MKALLFGTAYAALLGPAYCTLLLDNSDVSAENWVAAGGDFVGGDQSTLGGSMHNAVGDGDDSLAMHHPNYQHISSGDWFEAANAFSGDSERGNTNMTFKNTPQPTDLQEVKTDCFGNVILVSISNSIAALRGDPNFARLLT